MSVFVKICGLRDADSVATAVSAGTNAVGFVFAESVRRVTPAEASAAVQNIPAEVQRVLASGLEAVPPTWRAYTRRQLIEGRVPPDPWSRRVLVSFHRERSGDVELLL